MKQYWKNYFWEYLMCVAASAALLLITVRAFYIPDALAKNIPLAVVICAALLFLFFLGGYNKVGLVLVPLITAALTVLCFLLLRSRGVDIVDEEGSETAFYIYWFAFAVICIVVYLCSRVRLGVALMMVVGCFVCGVLHFLEFPVPVWPGMVFAGSCIALFLLRQFRVQAMNSSTANPNFFQFFRSGIVLVLAGALLSCGVFFAIIRPLDPPTIDLEFLEKYLAFNILEHTGISDTYDVQDKEETTDESDDTLDDTEEIDEGDSPVEQIPDTPYDAYEQTPDDTVQPPGQTELSAVSYTITPLALVILWCVLIALVIILPPVIRIQLRRRRMKKVAAMEPRMQIQTLYRFYLKKFRHVGWKKRTNETPLEFAARSGDALERYLPGVRGMERLTDTFVETRYGGSVPTDAVCTEYRQIYGEFLKSYKQQMGRVRYLLKFYVL